MRTLKTTFIICLLACAPLAAQDDLAGLRERMAAQQKQIEELRTALAEQQKLLEALTQKPPAAPAAPAKTLVADDGKPVSPLSFRIGGADFTPGGFMDLTSIFRSTNVGSGIGTSFGGLPFSNAAAGQLTESRFSAQNSRLTLRVNAKTGKETVTGYVEADFLGALPNNGFVTSNSDSMRMRLYWVQVLRGKWEVLGGQSWSMLTPNRAGISPLPGDLFFSQNVDTNYQVGLTWTRAPQFRLIYHANKNWTAGFSLENPEQYVGTSVVLPSSYYTGQFDTTAATSTPNMHPDIIGKIAADGHAGSRAMHVEAVGLLRTFRSLRQAGGTSHAMGAGGSLNMNLELAKNFRFLVNTFYSNGGGRYIFGLGPDAIVRADGTVSPVHATSGIAGFEFQSDPKTAWYTYYGGAYFSKNCSVGSPGQFFGFGCPGSSNANREIQELTFGFTRTFWKNPNYGALQWMTQYSYVTRNPWVVAAGSPSGAHAHMIYLNLRYVLP
jgi:Porin subfamily